MADLDIPEEMVEAAARELYGGPHYRTKVVDDEVTEYTVTWDEAEDDGHFGRDIYRRQARRVLSAALDRRAVVAPPAPDDNTDRLEGATAQWSLPEDVIGVYPDRGRPIYSSIIGGYLTADEAEAEALVLLAAARLARRGSESAQ